ncbi:hypothetical protein [Spirosoma horti]
MIPTIAIQEFFEELNSLLKSQPDEWQATPPDQKELVVSVSDFDYYRTIRQQIEAPSALETDAEGMPILFFSGIRVRPIVSE